VAGVALGNLGNALGAAIGLAALFAISSLAFLIVKYAGAAYLIYLGVKTIRDRSSVATAQNEPMRSLARIFRDGFFVALLNPKTAVFFAAFLPQFMNASSPPMSQSILLGAIFVAIAAFTDTVYALAAGAIAPVLTRNRRVGAAGKYFSGSAFIGLGLLTALSGSRLNK
jgi:threonine/homoserine/homoserine lactone efflux protein